MKRWMMLGLFVAVMGLMAVGCQSSGGAMGNHGGVSGSTDEPKWVSRGSGIFPGDKGRALYAVGMSTYEPNERLQRKLAGQDARVEIANQMQIYVAAMVKDFMQSHKDFADPKNSSSIAFTSAVSKSITEATLYGSTMLDSWRDPQTKNLYMLFTMPLGKALEESKAAVMAKAREKAAETFKAKADEALKELDSELDKRKAAESK